MKRLPILLLLLLLPLGAAAEESNAGIVQGLWYSKEHVFAGEPVRVYVAIRNNTGSDLSGTVEFFVNDDRIARKSVDALNGRIIESWADWTPEYGTSTIAANLSRIVLSSAGTSTEETEAVSALAKSILFVDRDTDHDGTGDAADEDDDDDGITDAAEMKAGTDPHRADAPKEKEEKTDAPVVQGEAESESLGLERFFTPSPAEETLSRMTHAIGTMKEAVDTLREKRASSSAHTASSSAGAPEDTASSGEAAAKDGAFFDSLLSGTHALGARTIDLILFLLSGAFAHPALLEFAALIIILFLLIRFAARFGRRPRNG